MMKLSCTLSACYLIASTQAVYIPESIKHRTSIPEKVDLAGQLEFSQAPPIVERATSTAECPIENLLSACGTLREDNNVPEDCECATFCSGEYLGCASFDQAIYGIGCSGVLIAGCQTSASAADESSSAPTPVVPAFSSPSDEVPAFSSPSDEDEEDSERANILIGGAEDEIISSSTHISSRITFLLLAASVGAFFL
eukprot:CAMPEP_0195258254 /NCGR_PEP_ID=MMETSP0706-20130129/7297_1 /TAXON_ID=33640 /ORGANISM="Asterionellopsis glacialis, Strain CCMP134" /LENGTH=196 /DNA_ID=CAMNT_0040311603 /DNA_START=23 /DNA_END=613 /DNA_ORIENTATION=-